MRSALGPPRRLNEEMGTAGRDPQLSFRLWWAGRGYETRVLVESIRYITRVTVERTTYNWEVVGSTPFGVVLVEGGVHRSVRLSVLSTHPPSSGRNHSIPATNHGPEKPGWSYLHRGNPRRFSLNIPSKIVRPN